MCSWGPSFEKAHTLTLLGVNKSQSSIATSKYFVRESEKRGQAKGLDEFEEMEEVMHSVNTKLKRIESSLLSVVDSKKLHLKRNELTKLKYDAARYDD